LKRTFIYTKVFDKKWSELNLTDDDQMELENFIMSNPNAGDRIQGTGGAIKLRWSLPNTGKSGGIRVIYIELIKAEQIHMLTCYPKSDKDNLTDGEKTAIKEVIKRIISDESEV